MPATSPETTNKARNDRAKLESFMKSPELVGKNVDPTLVDSRRYCCLGLMNGLKPGLPVFSLSRRPAARLGLDDYVVSSPVVVEVAFINTQKQNAVALRDEIAASRNQ